MAIAAEREFGTASHVLKSVRFARSVLALIEQHGSPADPKAFAVWHAFAAGQDRPLVSAIDGLIASKGAIDQGDIDFLHRVYVARQPAVEHADETTGALAGEFDKAMEVIDLAVGAATRYDQSLHTISDDLHDEMGVDDVRGALHDLTEVTRQTITENRTLNLRLHETRQEINNLREALGSVRQEALTDALTGLSNRRHFDSMIGALSNQAKSRGTPLALMMLDVDHFKGFNDRFGHQTGDQVLKLVAAAIRQHMPEQATSARYGGEEFAVLLPGHDLARAMRVAELIRSTVRSKELVKRSSGKTLGRITVSLGVAMAHANETVVAFVERADRCLLGAKALGRDRSVCETELPIHVAARRSA